MEKFNQYLIETLQSDVPYYNEVIRYINENKGKQIRSKLSLLCAGLGGTLNDRSYRAALIVEMLHTASLLHDDIIDNSKERRSAPSINKIWGEKIALLSGNIISLKAMQLSLKYKDYDIYKVFVEALRKIVQGELLQLNRTAKLDTSEQTYLEIIESKTGAFFYAGCKAGAMSTFHHSEKVEQLGVLGEYIGIAFQMKDDLFGYQDNSVGKPMDNDFQEKKVTLPIIYTINRLEGKKKRRIKRIFRKKKLSREDINIITSEVHNMGGLTYTIDKMQQYGQMAIDILDNFPDSDEKAELYMLLRFATERNF